jgi:hypothetical protein
MSYTQLIDNEEKLNILFKNFLGVVPTTNNRRWFEEGSIIMNNYINGEDIFIDKIPLQPDFDICGIVLTSQDIGLDNSDFINYKSDSEDKYNSSIVDDKTGTIRRFKFMILDEVPFLPGDSRGFSWSKQTNDNNNILIDSIQYNLKEDKTTNTIPYKYNLYSQYLENASDVINNDDTGGNWIFDIKSGVLFFPNFSNFDNSNILIKNNNRLNVTNNKPVLTFYKYVGKKGIQSYYKIYNITNINVGKKTDILVGRQEKVLYDVSLNVIAKKSYSKYKLYINLNYFTSKYYNAYLSISLYYKLLNQQTGLNDNILIGEYNLGTGFASYMSNVFNNIITIDINCKINSIINFYITYKISTTTQNNNIDYDNLESKFKPVILLSKMGNSICVEELNI